VEGFLHGVEGIDLAGQDGVFQQGGNALGQRLSAAVADRETFPLGCQLALAPPAAAALTTLNTPGAP
jgi:hypothetical protein